MDALQHLQRTSRFDSAQQSYLDRLFFLVASFGFTPSGSPIVETKPSRNRWVLEPGLYGGFILEEEHGYVVGFGGQSIIRGQVIVRGSARLVGLTFTQSDLNPDQPLVVVDTDDAVVVCEDCHFEKLDNDGLIPHYHNTSPTPTGTAAFISCTFSGLTNQVAINPGAAADVYFIGCTRGALVGGWGMSTQVGAW